MLGWMGVVELLEIFNKRGRMPLPWAMFSGVLITVLFAGLEVLWPGAVSSNVPGQLGWMAIGLIVGLYLALFGELQRYDTKWHTTINLGLESFAILYLGGALGFIVQLRLLDFEPKDPFGLASPSVQSGMLALVSLIAIVKMSDVGQYAVGRLIGRHKLAPIISPGKTWEGVVGGLLFAVGGAFLVFGWAEPYIMGTPNEPTHFFSDTWRRGPHCHLCHGARRGRYFGRLVRIGVEAGSRRQRFEQLDARLRWRARFARFAARGGPGRLPVVGARSRRAVMSQLRKSRRFSADFLPPSGLLAGTHEHSIIGFHAAIGCLTRGWDATYRN